MKKLILFCILFLCSIVSYAQITLTSAAASSGQIVTVTAQGETNSKFIDLQVTPVYNPSAIAPTIISPTGNQAWYASMTNLVVKENVTMYNPNGSAKSSFKVQLTNQTNEPITVKFALKVTFLLNYDTQPTYSPNQTVYYTVTINPAQPTTYYNVAKTVNFTRNNCGTGYIGSTVPYTVPANKYSSTVSQADADAKAQAEINANGQNNANQNGTCTIITYYNVAKSGTFTKNDCSSGIQGSTVTYTVPANKYSSTVSQEDADAKATAEVNSAGQGYANSNGYCLEQVQTTFTVSSPNSTNIMIYIDGQNLTGPRSIPAYPATNQIVTGSTANATATVVVEITSGYYPYSATLTGHWGTITGATSPNKITFLNVPLKSTQSISLKMN